MDSVLSAGLAGIQAGQSSAFEAAQKITTATAAQAPSDTGSTPATSSGNLDAITTGAVELLASEQQVQASASVVKAADEILGTLIDIDV